MIKRFNPDFSLSISHELAYMRETPEGGYVAHGDYATLFSELESVKAERDAQQKRADALAVENASTNERVQKLIKIISNADNDYCMCGDAMKNHIHGGCWHPTGMFDYHYNQWLESDNETPATDAALAAIQAKEHADFIAVFNEHIKTAGLDDDELVTVRECRDALKHAAELREAK